MFEYPVYKYDERRMAKRFGSTCAWRRPNSHVMEPHRSKDPLHGVTLEKIVTELSGHFGWEKLGGLIDIRCFNFDPSVKSSLQFLRKTPWARAKVEALYLRMLKEKGGEHL